MTEPGQPPPERPCAVCGKECEPSDRNTDGTFAHRSCLYAVSHWRLPGVRSDF